MNSNTETVEQPAPAGLNQHFDMSYGMAGLFLGVGAAVILWLFIRADMKVAAIKRNFFLRKQAVTTRASAEYWQLRQAAIQAQRPQTLHDETDNDSPIHLPVTPADIRERRKITRLY
jgi:hypothetical protein